MNRMRTYEGPDAQGQPPSSQVPIGWQRKADHSGVVYISPSGSVLACLEQVKSYLLTDGTCKCGLECPLILHKVFNFDPGAAVKQRTAEDAKADEDVTKLCIHKRKIIAVATLRRSMESPSFILTSPGGGMGLSQVASMCTLTPRGARHKLHEGLASSRALDCKSPYRTAMTLPGQGHYQHELGSPPQQDPYSGYGRSRPGSGDHGGHKSPYRNRHGGLLSPTAAGSHLHADGSPSPRTDPLGSSPDPSALGFHGTCSPGSSHINGGRRTPLSPVSVPLHGSPVAAQASCALASRTNVPLSPTVTAKSPIMKKSSCSFPHARDVFQHKPQPGPHLHTTPSHSLLPPCVLQKTQLTSEKDPLGILDPIPSTVLCHPPPGIQPHAHSQVPPMNVNMPSAIVPLPSNLPVPTVKPGPIGHGNRVQHPAPSSISPSPVTSPVHVTGPALARMEASPHRSRSSSISSDHGSFAVPTGPQGSYGGAKVPPRSSMGSPHSVMPPGPTVKSDMLQHYKDHPSQLLGGMNNSLGKHAGPVYPPGLGSGSGPQKSHQGLLGLSQNHALNHHNSATFPASNLLSAAAKAQLANQNKLTGGEVASGAAGDGAGNPGHVVGVAAGNLGGHGNVNTMFPPNPPPAVIEGQSGRAALRDKLMAQQREALRKSKQLNSSNAVFSALKPQTGGSNARSPGPSELLRRASRQGGLPNNTSMAQLLQSMSSQNALNGQSHMGHSPARSGQSPFREAAVPLGPPLQSQQGPPCFQGRMEVSHSPLPMDGRGVGQDQHMGLMTHIQAPSSAEDFWRLGQGGQAIAGSTGHHKAYPQQLNHHYPQGTPHVQGRAVISSVMSNGCAQALSGESSSMKCGLSNLQSLKSGSHKVQKRLSQGQPGPQCHPQTLPQGLQDLQGHQDQHSISENTLIDVSSSNPSPMACLFQNFKVSIPERALRPAQSISTQSGRISQQEAQRLKEIFPELLGSEGLPGGGGEAVDAIYRAVVDAACKGTRVEITAAPTGANGAAQVSPVTALSAMSAFATASREHINLPRAVNSVIHGPPHSLSQDPAPLQPHAGRPRKTPERGGGSPRGREAQDYLRSPGRGTPRMRWHGEAEGPGQVHWGGEELRRLHAQAQDEAGSCSDGLGGRAAASFGRAHPEDGLKSYRRLAVNFKERLEQTVEQCAQMNGGGFVLGSGCRDAPATPRRDWSPGSSAGPVTENYSHYNGHFNGQLNGHYDRQYNGHNGHCTPSPSDGRMSNGEEDPQHPDSPSSGKLLQYHPRMVHAGELVWGPNKGFPPWLGKLGNEGHALNPGMLSNYQGKMEPERFQRALTEDLEAFDRAKKRTRNGGKLNNHLEAAIHEAMSELDKMATNGHQMTQRDRQVKTPKRRKISR